MSEASAVKRSTGPVTVESLAEDLCVLGIRPGTVLLVHSSMSALGWVCGGAVAVVEALMRIVTREGTLVMPTHSAQLSDPSNWKNPPVPESWWSVIRGSMPPFDPATTPTSGMGIIPEVFRTMPGVVRTNHPTCSMSAWGNGAIEIIRNHSLADPHGDESPLGRISDMDGKVLLLGVGHAANTSMHLAEKRLSAMHSPRFKRAPLGFFPKADGGFPLRSQMWIRVILRRWVKTMRRPPSRS